MVCNASFNLSNLRVNYLKHFFVCLSKLYTLMPLTMLRENRSIVLDKYLVYTTM